MSRYRRFYYGFNGIVLLVAAWELARFAFAAGSDLFPSIALVVGRSVELFFDGGFQSGAVIPSLMRLLAAAVIAVPVAIVFGMATGASGRLRALVQPVFNFTYPLPKVAIFPLMLALFGIGHTGKIALISIGIFYPLFFSCAGGVTRLKRSDFHDLIPIYRIRGWRLVRDFYFRGIGSDLWTGMKTSIGYGFTLVVVSEMTASNDGIGHFIWRSWDGYNILDLYAGIALLCFFGWIAQYGIDALSRRWLAT